MNLLRCLPTLSGGLCGQPAAARCWAQSALVDGRLSGHVWAAAGKPKEGLNFGMPEGTHQVKDERKTKKQLVDELTELRQRVAMLEAQESELKRTEVRMTAIHALGQELVLSRDVTHIAQLVVDAAQHVLRISVCGLWLVDEKQRMLALQAHTVEPLAPDVSTLPLDEGQGIVACVVHSEAPIYEPDVRQNPHYIDGGFRSRSEFCVPLRVGDQVIGALNAESDEPDGFDAADQQLLEALANSAAIAIENARLYKEAQKELKERTRADKALWESEKRFRSIAETASDAIIIFDSHENVYFWNHAAKNIFGYSGGETMGKLLASIMTGQFYTMLRTEMQQVVTTGQSELIGKAVEAVGLTKEGNEFPLELSLATWRVDQETFFTFIARDVTERKRAEEALRESEERFRNIFERTPIGIYQTTPDGRILMANPALVRMLRYSSFEELVQRDLEDEGFYPDYSREDFKRRIEGEGQVVGLEADWVRKDGQALFVRESARVVRDNNGKVLYYEGTVEDITAQKQALEALERRAAQLALINDIGGQIAAVLALDSVLGRAVHLIQESFGYHHVALFVLDRERDELLMRARAGAFTELFPADHRLKLGQGMVGWVGRHGERLLANDVDAEPRYVNLNPDVIPTRAELSVPIQVGEKVIGVLDVQSPQLNAFDDNDVMVIETLADQVAVAIDNARLYEETARRLAETRVLQEVALATASTLDFDQVLARAIQIIHHSLGVEYLSFAIPSESGDYLVVHPTYIGYDSSPDGSVRLSLEESVCGRVYTSGQPELISDTTTVSYYFRELDAMRSELAVPVRVGDRVAAVLNAESTELDAFSERDLRTFEAIAVQLGVAMHNAQLYEAAQQELAERKRAEEEIRRRSAQLEALQQVSLEITSQLDLDALLHSIASRAVELLGENVGGLYLYRPERDVLEWAVVIGESTLEPGDILQRGEGLAGKVWETGQTLIVDNYQQWQGRAAKFDRLRMAGIVSAPVRWGDEFLGVLTVVSNTPSAFSSADAEMLSLLASQAAIAIQNVHLFEEARSRAERLAVVNRIARAAGATLHVDDLVETVYHETVPAFRADAFFIALYDGEAQELDFRLEVDEGVRQAPGRLPLGTGLTSLVVTEKKPLIIRDLEQEKDRLPVPMLWGSKKPPLSWLGAPMLVGKRVMGVISVQAYSPHVWDEEDEQLLFTIADQVAVALENIRLFEDIQAALEDAEEHARRQVLLNEMADQLNRMADLDQVLDATADTISQIFAADRVSVALLTAEGDSFEVLALRGADGAMPVGTRLPVEGTAIGMVVRENRLNVVPDTSDGGALDLNILAQQGVRSAMSAPLIVGGRALGVLNVGSERPHVYTQGDGHLLLQIASFLASAIENRRLFDEVRTRAEELAVLNELGRDLTARLDVREVLEEAYRQASRLVDTTNFFIDLYDSAKDELTLVLEVEGGEVGWPDKPLPAGKGIGGYIVQNRTSVLIHENVGQWQQEHGIARIPLGDGQPAVCWLGVPLIVGDRVLGVIAVQSVATPRLYDEHDQELLTAIASQVAIALQNAYLFEETEAALKRAEQLAEELAVLNELGQALTARLSVAGVLNEAYRQASRLVDTTNFHIGLYDADRHEIHFAIDVTESEIDRHITVIDADQGTAGYVVRNRTSLLFEDNVGQRLAVLGIHMLGEETQSKVAVPLMVGGRVLGVMAVQSFTTPRLYGKHDLELLTAVANQAAIAIQNARLFENAQNRLAELTALQETSRAVASTLELDKLLNLIAQQAITLLQGGGGIVNLIDWDKEEDEVVAALGNQASALGTRNRLEDALSGWVALHNQPVISNQLQDDNRVDPRFQSGEIPGRSAVIAPLTVKGQVVGTLVVMDRPGGFDQADLNLLMTFADQAATAIENARLYEQAQRRAAQATLIYEMGRRVSGELELEALAPEAVAAVRDAFDYYSVALLLLDGEAGHLKMQAIARDDIGVIAPDVRIPIGKGMIGCAAATGQTQVSGDVSQDPRYLEMGKVDTKSELSVPIKSGQKVIAVLDIQGDELDAFDASDVMVMETVADQIAVAIDNARLYEETARRLAEMRVLQEMALATASTLDFDQVLTRAIQIIHRSLGIEHLSFALPSESGDYLVVHPAYIGFDSSPDGSVRLSLEESVCGRVYASGQPELISDTATVSYYYNVSDALRSNLAVPVRVGDRVAAVLNVESAEPGAFGERDLRTFEAIATQLGIVMQNAQLYEAAQQELAERKRAEEEIRRRSAQLEALQQVSLEITAQLDLDALLHSIASWAVELLGETVGGLYLYRPERDVLEWAVDIGGDAAWVGDTLHRGEGLAGRVWETGQTLMVDDYQEWGGRAAVYDGLHIAGVVSAPVRWGDEFLGVLSIMSDTPAAFSPDDAYLLDLLAGQAAIAIQNARLYEGAQQELTERKRAEAEIRKLNQFLDTVIDSADVWLNVLDQRGNVVIWNKAAEEISGYSRQEVMGHDKIWHWLYPDEAYRNQLLADTLAMTARGDAESGVETIIRRNDGRTRIISWNERTLLDDAGGRVGSIALGQDITERKWAEEQLRHYAAELEQANTELKRFTYIVSHDLRAPLVNLKGFAAELRFALETVGPTMKVALPHLDEQQGHNITLVLEEDVPEALDFIDSSVTRMDGFINALLKLSRLGRRDLKLEPIDMNALVESTLHTLAHQIEEHHTKVTVGQLPQVFADRTSMEQIMGNVLGNAVKYLTLDRPGEIQVTGERNNDKTRFHVRDNGRGIAKEDMDKVFAPFRRIGGQDVPGEGMGLPYVQALVRRHGGHIWCESEPGVGTTFTFTISNHLEEGGDHVENKASDYSVGGR